MAQNVIINGVTYQSVPEVDIPKSGGGTAKFYDTAGATASASDILTGKSAFGASGSISGSMANKVGVGNDTSRLHDGRNGFAHERDGLRCRQHPRRKVYTRR